jgi:hypothetical protein
MLEYLIMFYAGTKIRKDPKIIEEILLEPNAKK